MAVNNGNDFQNDEIVAYKKKSKTSSKSNSSKRSDHKHDYQKVVIESFVGYKWGLRCKICGRIDSKPMSYSSSGKDDFRKPESIEGRWLSVDSWLSIPEIRKKFPGTPIYVFDKMVPHGWVEYKEAEQ